MRYPALFISCCFASLSCAALAEQAVHKSNRSLPLPEVTAQWELPEHPSAADLARVTQFSVPLIPVEAVPGSEENEFLAAAVRKSLAALPTFDPGPFEQFLKLHPQSAWRPALQVNLAIGYYTHGWYSRSLSASQDAWELTKASKEPAVHRMAGRALAEWLKLNSRLGRVEVLESVLKEVQNRPISPEVGTWVASALEAAATMRSQPGFCFRCGPMALKEIQRHRKAPGDWESFLLATQSPPAGFSLKEVHEMSEKLGMKMQVARRSPGAEVLLPAVVHWKLGHYAALLDRLENSTILASDLTFAQSLAISSAALDHEASGLFIVPAGPLPAGWRSVSLDEAAGIFGKGFTGGPDKDPADCSTTPHTGGAGSGGGCGGKCSGMMGYSINLLHTALTLTDTPVGYSPPVGPAVDFTIRFHELMEPLNAMQPETLPLSSTQFVHNWLSYVVAPTASPDLDLRILSRSGSWRRYRNFNAASQSYDPEYNSGAVLRRVSLSPRIYELTHQDGTVETFSVSGPSIFGSAADNLYLSSVRDPQGNTVTLHYDARPRLIGITDAIGQVTAVTYRPADAAIPGADNQISRVTDPFGRFALFEYSLPANPGPFDLQALSRVTDTIGLVSEIEWGDSRSGGGTPGGLQNPPVYLPTALITPYGRTTFQRTVVGLNRRITVTDPQGDSEVVEYKDDAPGIPPTATNPFGGTTNWMQYRNTFHWTKEMWGHHPGDYLKAVNYHWQHSDPSSMTGNTLESVKHPLENRVWFTNPGQFSPTDRGTYSGVSSVSRFMDDGSIQRTSTDYNSRGNVTRDVDAAGRETVYLYAPNGIDLLETRRVTGNGPDDFARLSSATYNATHLPLTSAGPDGMITSYTWNARGQLLSVTDPAGGVTTLTYDADGYLTAVDGPLSGPQDTIRLTYDAYGRPATWSDVDGYTLAYQYDALDRLTRVSYMDGTYEEYTYHRLDKASSRDREGRITTWTHNALRQMISQTDPANRTLRYEWCRCGDLRVLYDAMGRATQWKRDIQGRVVAKVYADGSQYRYEYERASSRLKRRTDAKGQFTDYQWTADDQVARIEYPNAEIATPTCTYTYDPVFNRMTSAIAGPEPLYYSYHPITNTPNPGAGRLARRDGRYPDETLTYAYDARGLRTLRTFAGMRETWAYDLLGRVTTNGNPAGNFLYTYEGATRRMATCAYPNGILATHTYFGHTGSHRLQRMKYEKAGSVLAQFDYTYSPVGNIVTWGQKVGTDAPMISRSYTYDSAYQLVGVTGSDGTEDYEYDPAGNRINHIINGVSKKSAYDSLNQLVSTEVELSAPQAFTWDGENRLSKLTKGTQGDEWSITRNAEGIPAQLASAVGIQRVVYDGFQVTGLQKPDGTWVLSAEGSRARVSVNQPPEFAGMDHLASCRLEVRDSESDKLFNYSAFGITAEGRQGCYIGFTGYISLDFVGVYIAPFREYLPLLGRWLTRDPAQESGGVNLYLYVENNPANYIDPDGMRREHPNSKSGTWPLCRITCASSTKLITNSWGGAVGQFLCAIMCPPRLNDDSCDDQPFAPGCFDKAIFCRRNPRNVRCAQSCR